jgi:sarcosine oxidase subunit delta
VSFLLPCPHCGERPQPEFAYGGTLAEPDAAPARALDAVTEDLYFSDNRAGLAHERWFHRFGCERWIVVARDSRTNAVTAAWPGVAVPR